MRHNQASHAGLSLQYRQDLCSIRRCFSPKALDITFHSFPYYFPVHSLDFRTPVLWKPLAVEKASALGKGGGGGGNNKKVEQQEDGPTGLAKAPVSVCFPAPKKQSSNQEAAGVSATSTSKLLPLPSPPSPPGKGKEEEQGRKGRTQRLISLQVRRIMQANARTRQLASWLKATTTSALKH